MPLPRLARPTLPGPANAGLAVVGAIVVGATLGGPLALVLAAALTWLWWGRPLALAGLFALALGFAAWIAPTPHASTTPAAANAATR